MPSALLSILILAQTVSAPRRAELAAASSPRPAVCTPRDATLSANRQAFWDRLRTPGLDGYCNALAQGYTRLARQPAAALEAADLAHLALPGRAGAYALRGRALLRLGRLARAWRAFERARSLDPRSLDIPSTLHDVAVAGALSGHLNEAVEAYRALVVRAPLLPSQVRRQRVYVEAAVWLMATQPASLGEAIGYLAEARRQGVLPGCRALVLGALALALDRQGHAEQARGVAAEAGVPWGLVRLLPDQGEDARDADRHFVRAGAWDGALPILPLSELRALIAILAERVDREFAAEQWSLYLGMSSDLPGAHVAHAKHKLEQLRGRGRQRRAR